MPGFRFKVRIDGRIAGPARAGVHGADPVRERRGGGPFGGLPADLRAPAQWPPLAGSDQAHDLRRRRLGPADRRRAISTITGWRAPPGRLHPARHPRPRGLSARLGGAGACRSRKPRRPGDPQPPGRWIDSAEVPGFRIQARLTSDGTSRILRKEACIAETFCLSGALPGVTELLVRVPGPKPNGYFWPTLARFTPATLEMWVQQKNNGEGPLLPAERAAGWQLPARRVLRPAGIQAVILSGLGGSRLHGRLPPAEPCDRVLAPD